MLFGLLSVNEDELMNLSNVLLIWSAFNKNMDHTPYYMQYGFYQVVVKSLPHYMAIVMVGDTYRFTSLLVYFKQCDTYTIYNACIEYFLNITC